MRYPSWRMECLVWLHTVYFLGCTFLAVVFQLLVLEIQHVLLQDEHHRLQVLLEQVPCRDEQDADELLATAKHEAAHAIVWLRLAPNDLDHVAVYPYGILQPGEELCLKGRTFPVSLADRYVGYSSLIAPTMWEIKKIDSPTVYSPSEEEPLPLTTISEGAYWDIRNGRERILMTVGDWCEQQIAKRFDPLDAWSAPSDEECSSPSQVEDRISAATERLVAENDEAIEFLARMILTQPEYWASGTQLACFLDAFDRNLSEAEVRCVR